MSLRRLPVLPSMLLVITAVLAIAWAAGAWGQTARPPATPLSPEIQRQRELERDAAVNLSLAKKSIQDDAFYNAKVALNVWKSSAVDAGNFDQKLYDDLRRQLYEKSLRDNLRCIDHSIAQRDAHDANLCLKIYRLHATELGTFDPNRYEELRARVAGIKKREK
jgi:hypothetical protein